GLVLWLGAWHLSWQGKIGWPALLLLVCLGQFLLYTVLHESVHGIVSRNRFVNDLCGMAASTSFMAPFWGFRYVHLKHHRFTNRPEQDPDLWSAASSLPFRWLTQ